MSKWGSIGIALVVAACGVKREPAPETTAVSGTAAPPADAATPRELPGRALTSAERGLLAPLFGDSLEYDTVRVINGRFMPLQPSNVYMAPEGNIYAPGHLYRDDFAAPEHGPYVHAVFVHEMLHVWQHQSGINLLAEGVGQFLQTGGNYEATYPYLLATDRDLLDYGMEQQASIVADYLLITGYGLSPHRLINSGLAPDARAALYAAVLGHFLSAPRYARTHTAIDLAKHHSSLASAILRESAVSLDAEPPVEYMCAWRHGEHDGAHH